MALAMAKLSVLSNLFEMLKPRRIQEAYYLLSICKLLKELERHLLFTPEESRAIEEALESALK
jgi:hypothetical protein